MGAVALVPLVHPGVRVRLVPVGGAWCDAQRAYNLLPDAAPLDVATGYAQVAAAAWFDGVRVIDAREVAPGLVRLTTHARTNGVVADWTIALDAAGVRSARFVATRFAVAPFEAQIEGLTALPGLSRGFERAADGLLVPAEPLFPSGSVVDPNELVAVDRMPDGFEIQFQDGGTPFYPKLDEPPLHTIREATRENYAEFLAWGVRTGWPGRGTIFVYDASALQCLACVRWGEEFNVHLSSRMGEAMTAIGYTYPDERAAMSSVLGHEIFHNIQHVYAGSAAASLGGAFVEGTARFQETLHVYSWVSPQAGSVVYARDANGCNDELGVQTGSVTLFDGPATDQSYSACDLWLGFHGRHGLAGIEALTEASPGQAYKTGWAEIHRLLVAATGRPVEDEIARSPPRSSPVRTTSGGPRRTSARRSTGAHTSSGGRRPRSRPAGCCASACRMAA